ncbi:hypothetical protein SAMN05444581_1344 [Methylocapsa palsarum]|uniref:Uncharacterized protein n=1 Tax=Methylocapsa palsarum TaxID=1612308 RepID=A0A1I4CZS8_9HYPH|nr:hypothetical protein SAMN05444581_1344 [Methylocapsa palsarum]
MRLRKSGATGNPAAWIEIEDLKAKNDVCVRRRVNITEAAVNERLLFEY